MIDKDFKTAVEFESNQAIKQMEKELNLGDKALRIRALEFASQMYINDDGNNGVNSSNKKEFINLADSIHDYIANGKTIGEDM